MFKSVARLAKPLLLALSCAAMAQASGLVMCNMCSDPQMSIKFEYGWGNESKSIQLPDRQAMVVEIPDVIMKKASIRFTGGTSNPREMDFVRALDPKNKLALNLKNVAFMVVQEGMIECFDSSNKRIFSQKQ